MINGQLVMYVPRTMTLESRSNEGFIIYYVYNPYTQAPTSICFSQLFLPKLKRMEFDVYVNSLY